MRIGGCQVGRGCWLVRNPPTGSGWSCSLLEHCRRHRYLAQSGEELALLLSSLLENLLAYRTITQDESPEHRMSCTVNVLVRTHTRTHTHTHTRMGVSPSIIDLFYALQNFYKEKKREDIYIR